MLVRFALFLHSQSPAAYNMLRESGIIKLPGETTLKDYTNYVHPKCGYNPHVVEELKAASSKLPTNQ